VAALWKRVSAPINHMAMFFDYCFQVAKAVEQSEVILMCMSQKYKDSPNCRLEGEYCVNKKISFVPLMMQQGYSPDGWCVSFITFC
jgi:hypothetical protein